METLRILDIEIYYKLGEKVTYIQSNRKKAKPIYFKEDAISKQNLIQRGFIEQNLMKGLVTEMWAELRNP